MTIKVQTLGVLCLVVTLGCAAAQGNEDAEKAAVEAADQWLEYVDGGDWAKSYSEAAEYFRSAVTKEQWTQQISAVRSPLGKVTSREVKKATYTKSLPGAPDGDYVVIQTKASFENKASAVETITPMLDKDGEWHVSGYLIK